MTAYKMVTGNASLLEIRINELLEEGWVLYGSPFSNGQTPSLICQAMIRQQERKMENGDNSKDSKSLFETSN